MKPKFNPLQNVVEETLIHCKSWLGSNFLMLCFFCSTKGLTVWYMMNIFLISMLCSVALDWLNSWAVLKWFWNAFQLNFMPNVSRRSCLSSVRWHWCRSRGYYLCHFKHFDICLGVRFGLCADLLWDLLGYTEPSFLWQFFLSLRLNLCLWCHHSKCFKVLGCRSVLGK